MTQLDLFAALRAPAVRRPVDLHAGVVQGESDETLRLRHPRLAWESARIELHRHRASGLWMWSSSFGTSTSGACYRVGEKWGHFASSRDDALFYAIEELRAGLRGPDQDTRRIIAWLDGLTPL